MKTQCITYLPFIQLWNKTLPYSFEPFYNFNTYISEDFSETEREYILTVNLPNFKKRDIKIKIENNQLIIEGINKKRNEFSSFQKSIPVYKNMDINSIKANFKSGNLIIKVPKMNSTYRKIPIGESFLTNEDAKLIVKENWIKKSINSLTSLWKQRA